MVKVNGLRAIALAGVAALTLAACGGSDEPGGTNGGDGGNGGDETFSIGFALKVQDAPYFVSLAEAVVEYGSEHGWDITVLDAGGDQQQESANMDTFIAQGKDLIFVDAIEPEAIVPSINAAAEAGIPVINLDSGVSEDANDVTTVYSDNKENGRLVGMAYAEHMGDEEIQAVILSGSRGNVAGLERRTGLFAGIIQGKLGIEEEEAWELSRAFEDELTSTGQASNDEAGFHVLGQGWGEWTENVGLTAAEDLITANPNITTFLGENDDMLFGAITALGNSGLQDVDIVAAADGAKKAMDMIREGNYFATGLNSPSLVARTGIDIAYEILVEGVDPDSYDRITLTEPAAITAENVDEYYDLGF